ncbi:MAG: beta-N-acetylhexosaminidase [Candidatus Bathyarchaeia archaeon]
MLSLKEKIGQMLVVGFKGLEPPEYILDWLGRGRIGGVILFSRNIENPKQLADLTKACREASNRPILVAIDQEGGVVARLREGCGFTESPGAMALAVAGSEELAEEVSHVLAVEMSALGINWNLAPVLDLAHNIDNPSVGVRSLGVDPREVRRLGMAQVRGFQRVGVASTAKHLPGKADTPVDPHKNLPVIDGRLEDMRDNDLVPFKGAIEAGVAAVMITHVKFRDLEPEYPSTMSPRIIQKLLRGEMGYRGVITTDCMEMRAVTNLYGPGESAVIAARAGANIILFSHTRDHQEEAYRALLDAVKSESLSTDKVDFSVKKILEMKNKFPTKKKMTTQVIHSPEHTALTLEAARRGTAILKNNLAAIPIETEENRDIALLEFASQDSVASEEHTLLAEQISNRIPRISSVIIAPNKPSKEAIDEVIRTASSADLTILATRNAHLKPEQRGLAQKILTAGREVVHLCLRNPYDAGVLTGAGSVICTFGDSHPSLVAASEALTGGFNPPGKIPVPIATR